jgi:hypothetical protein
MVISKIMHTPQERDKRNLRIQRDENAIKKQTKIAQAHGMDVKEPHKFAKHHAMDCGQPGCVLCGNPRKTFNELTAQEKRLFQDVEQQRDTHSNGLPRNQDD